MGVGDYVHEDANTGRAGSVAFREQRARAAAMQQSWTEGAGIAEIPLSDARESRSEQMRNLRSGFGQQDRIRRHIETYGSEPT